MGPLPADRKDAGLIIRPFLIVPDLGAEEAGVLRGMPSIREGENGGKNPPCSPWGGDRGYDTYLTLAEMRAAQGES
jgi:hypothetical protein